ncbi:MAG: hypothetical protein ACYS7Y_36720 [Planctomycetota bacterium]|jgi:hypothetical protein
MSDKYKMKMQDGLRDAISFAVKSGGRTTGYTVFLKTWMLEELCEDLGHPFDPDIHGRMYFGRVTAQIMDNLVSDKALILREGTFPQPSDLKSA